MIGPYARKYAEAIWGRLAAYNASSLSDEQIEEILGSCVCAHFLVPAAKELRDAGALYFDGGPKLLPHVRHPEADR